MTIISDMHGFRHSELNVCVILSEAKNQVIRNAKDVINSIKFREKNEDDFENFVLMTWRYRMWQRQIFIRIGSFLLNFHFVANFFRA